MQVCSPALEHVEASIEGQTPAASAPAAAHGTTVPTGSGLWAGQVPRGRREAKDAAICKSTRLHQQGFCNARCS